jgi:hypothetical protein
VPASILEDHADSAAVRDAAPVMNSVVWLAFCAEYVGNLFLARHAAIMRAGAGSICSSSSAVESGKG